MHSGNVETTVHSTIICNRSCAIVYDPVPICGNWAQHNGSSERTAKNYAYVTLCHTVATVMCALLQRAVVHFYSHSY